MAASNLDKFKKGARKWVGQIGAAGVTDAAVTTIPLSSTTNLPTDTAIVAVIDRVDANGMKTASLEESVIGVVSGSNLVTSTRGAEGTAQAHLAGAVVEIVLTNKGWGDLIDGILVQHNQLGLHTNITASDISASATTETLHLDLLASGDLRDVNNNELLKFTQTASAVNEFTVKNSIVGSGPDLCATGNDTDINLNLVPKGTGRVQGTSVTIPTISSTDTLTNKRITKRTDTVTSSATPTINTDTTDIFTITALAVAITSFTTNLSGTPTLGQTLIIRILDNGTARAITWGASFVSRGAILPTTTVLGKYQYNGFIWNSTTSTFDLVATVNEA